MSGIMDFLAQLFTDPYQQGGGPIASLLNPGSAASTATPLTPVSPVAGSPFQFRPGLFGDSIIGRAVRGGLAGLASSTGYTGGSAIGAGFEGATDAARKRQLFNMQNLQAGQEYQGGALNLLSSRLQLERTFKQYQYFQMIPKDMTFDQWVATQGQAGQAAGGPPASAPQVGQQQPPALDPTAQGGQPESTWQPQGGSVANAPQVGQTQPQGGQTAPQPSAGDNAYGIDPDLVNVTDPSAPKVQYALQRLAFMMGQPAADLAQKNIIAGRPYQTGLAILNARAAAGNANITDRGAGTGIYALRTDDQGNPLPPTMIARNPVQVGGLNAAGQPTTNFVFPPVQGAAAEQTPGGPPSLGQGSSLANAPQIGALPPALWTAQQYVESHFDPKLISPKGATGAGQFMPGTAAQYGGNGTDAQKAYMGDLYKKYGNLPTALVAYNWGPGNTDAWIKAGADPQKLPAETQKYVSSVLDLTGQQGAPAPAAGQGGQSDGIVTGLSPFQQKRQGQFADTTNALENSVVPTLQAEQRVLAIMEAMKKFNSGTWSTIKADVIGGLNSAGIPLPKEIMDDPAQVQIALKNNFQAALTQISGFSSQPAAISLTQAQENFAHPNLQPEANLAIGAQAVGTMRWQRAMIADLQKAKLNGTQDPNEFALEWSQKHPLQPYIDAAAKDIGPLKGMAPQSNGAPNTTPPPPPGFIPLQ